MDKLLTVKEAAVLLHTTEAALRYSIHRGTAPGPGKIGGRRLFRESDVQAFIAAAFAD